jgi:formyltetrahydrofolate deformylase
MKNTAVLLSSSPIALARKGGRRSSDILVAPNGSVAHAGDHIDSGRELFLSRLEWDLDAFDIPISSFRSALRPVADAYRIKYQLALSDPRIAILVSTYDHCLADLLYRHSTGDLPCTISILIASDPAARPLAEFHGVPFHLLSDPKNKQARSRKCSTSSGRRLTSSS